MILLKRLVSSASALVAGMAPRTHSHLWYSSFSRSAQRRLLRQDRDDCSRKK